MSYSNWKQTSEAVKNYNEASARCTAAFAPAPAPTKKGTKMNKFTATWTDEATGEVLATDTRGTKNAYTHAVGVHGSRGYGIFSFHSSRQAAEKAIVTYRGRGFKTFKILETTEA